MSSLLVGKKRKRDSHSVNYGLQLKFSGNSDVSATLTGKLHHGLKAVRKSAKKVKTFEKQKLVKKLKHLRSTAHSGDKVAQEKSDLEAQLEYLKSTDYERIAHFALSSKIRKDKLLSSNEVLTSALVSATHTSTSTTTKTRHMKIESRLLSSKLLAGEVDSVLTSLKSVLEPKPMLDRANELIEPTRTYEVEGLEGQKEKMLYGSTDEAGDYELYGKNEEVSGNFSDEVGGIFDMADYNGWESGSVDAGDGSSDNAEPLSPTASHKSKQLLTTRQTGITSSEQSTFEAVSTFLPSLSVGFVEGDSGSVFNESDEDVSGAGRKNRRGQRARQAIWEKKYGRNARHLHKRKERGSAVSASIFDKRLVKGWSGNPGISPTDGGRSREHRNKSSSAARFLHPGPRGVERPVHPSWEAKKKLKERERANMLPFQGKKVVFR